MDVDEERENDWDNVEEEVLPDFVLDFVDDSENVLKDGVMEAVIG